MLAHQLYFTRTALMVFAILFIPLTDSVNARQAPDPSLVSLPQPAQAEPLPLGTLLDSEGKPIIIPSEPQSGFEYSAPTTSAEPKTKTPKSTTATKANKNKKLIECCMKYYIHILYILRRYKYTYIYYYLLYAKVIN